MGGTEGIKVGQRNQSRGRQQKLTARKREGKGLKQTKANGEKQESRGGGLSGQGQTERWDLPLSFQRERRQTASAERMRERRGSRFITRHSCSHSRVHPAQGQTPARDSVFWCFHHSFKITSSQKSFQSSELIFWVQQVWDLFV